MVTKTKSKKRKAPLRPEFARIPVRPVNARTMSKVIEAFRVSPVLTLPDKLDARIELKEATRVVAAFTILARKEGGQFAKAAPLYRQALRRYLQDQGIELPSYEDAVALLAEGNHHGRPKAAAPGM